MTLNIPCTLDMFLFKCGVFVFSQGLSKDDTSHNIQRTTIDIISARFGQQEPACLEVNFIHLAGLSFCVVLKKTYNASQTHKYLGERMKDTTLLYLEVLSKYSIKYVFLLKFHELLIIKFEKSQRSTTERTDQTNG